MAHKLENGIVGKLIKAAPPDGDAIYFDELLSGFGLRIRNGKPSWIFQFRNQEGRTRRAKLGENLSAAQARGLARKLAAKIELGQDPSAEKAEQRKTAALSLASLLDDFVSVQAKTKRKNTVAMYRLFLTTGDYFKALRAMPAASVKRADVAKAVRKIEENHGPISASRARTCLSAAFGWAMREGVVEGNPVVGTNKIKEKSRDRVLSENELIAIWRASGDDEFGQIIRLLILSAARRCEIGDLSWSEVNRQDRTIVLPAERMKNGRTHIIASDAAVRLTEKIVRVVGKQHLFGGASDVGFRPWAKCKSALDERLAGQMEGGRWTMHDIRRSVATHMERLAIAPHIIEIVLGHEMGSKVAKTCNRSGYTKEVQAAFAQWADHVAKITSGKAPKKHERVATCG
jgi:integrase